MNTSVLRRKRVAVIVAATLGLGLAAAPAAIASGTGNTVLGCTAQWWNTAFSSKCVKTGQSASFRTTGWCDYQPTRSGPWQYVGKGSTVYGVSPGQCTFGVYKAQTTAS